VEDLSLHILDISENSIEAGATEIEIVIDQDTEQNRLLLEIKDNGQGFDPETQAKVLDPFYTTKITKKVGLGLPLLAQAAKETGGNLTIQSHEGKGTIISAQFILNHIDRKPLGNIAETIIALIAARGASLDIRYRHSRDGLEFSLDTREIKGELIDIPVNEPIVLNHLKNSIYKSIQKLNMK